MVSPRDATADFRLLGSVEVLANGQVLQLGGRRQRTLLALLLLEEEHAVSVERLAEELWHGHPPPAAAKTLRSYVSRLRAALGHEVVVARSPGYALAVTSDQIDVRRFERLLRHGQEALARGAAGLAAERLHSALGLWRGPALADVAESGLLELEAKRLEDLRLVCLEKRIEADLALGRHAELATELERLVTAEPLREAFWRQLVLSLYRCERQADALAAYRRARTTLNDLGLEPSKELKELEQAILRHDVEAAVPEGNRHNLHSPLTSFVGRERELTDIQDALREHRLLILTGVGGSGKTRLALEVAARQIGAWRGGVWLVDLATVSEPTLVPNVVAGVLPVSERQPSVSARDLLLEDLRHSELLLVLDNCEHLVDACSELAETLLHSCPNLKLLATSRIPLSAAGGSEYAVDPLPVPPETASVGELERSPSVQLFLERGRAVRFDLASTPERLTTIGGICRELDGLPLAIELAAARVKALSLEEIEARLDDRFRFLRSWRRIADPRHQTLKATMDWSYELLSDEKSSVLQGMSVFAGGSTLDAIALVCCGGDRERALECVDGLIDASLVHADERSAPTRYRLLETVRQYAADRLDESGKCDELRRQHAEFFTCLAEAAAVHSETADVLVAFAEDEGNYRSALSFCAVGREPELMLRLAGALWLYWSVRDQHDEARGWLEHSLQHDDGSAPHARALALRRLGGSVIHLGGHAEARALFREALALHEELGDDDGVARCLNNLGRVALDEGDLDDATAFFEQALAIHRRVDDEASVAVPLMNLSDVALRRGDLAERRRLCEELLARARDRQDELWVASALVDLAFVAAFEGRYEDVAALAEEALRFFSRIEAIGSLTLCVLLMALVLASRGRRVDAARLVGAATAERVRRGWPGLPESMYGHRHDQFADAGPSPFAALERDFNDASYTAARAEGAAIPFGDAVEFAARALSQTAKGLQPA